LILSCEICRRVRRGYSLVEILIMLVVVTIALLGLMGSFAYGVRANAQAQKTATATGYAAQVMDMIRTNNYAWVDPSGNLNDPSAATRKALNAAPLTMAPDDAGFTRNVEITQGIGAGYKANIARIKVRVFWRTDAGTEKTVELVGFSTDLAAP
jgi:type II secretory pathway pseudopilin PulG